MSLLSKEKTSHQTISKSRRELVRWKVAGPFWRLFLHATGGDAVFVPWGAVYVLPEALFDPGLRAHEAAHVKQLNRHGALKYWILAAWYLCRYGYKGSPFEVEARAAQHATHDFG